MNGNSPTEATLITVAPTGAESDKSAVPALHLRVGMEDTLSFARGRPVTGNAELVERAATLAGLAQRPPMGPEQARAMLGVSGRS
jgi:uncharacterized protein (DUF849 family)